ncbi:MAG: hypothetical protein R6W76_17630, partial [Caldilinea sp.]
VMTAGVGLFGTLSGFLANQFLTPPKPKAEEATEIDAEDAKTKLAQLRRMIEAQEQSTAELKAQIAQIDRLLS